MSSPAGLPDRDSIKLSGTEELTGDSALELTFRDPAGQLQLTQTHALRRIRPAAVDETLAFLASPLRASLERNGDLVATEIAESPTQSSINPQPSDAGEGRELWIRHPRIDPISYPWEWTTGQWRAAAELTLRIAGQAIDAGWMLKDATPLNILFVGARPILVDVLSLERRDPHYTVWLAYGQFVRTFLLPLVAEKLLSWPLQATLFARDGYEPQTLYQALRPWQRLRPDLLDVVMLATLFDGSKGKNRSPSVRRLLLTLSWQRIFCTSASLAWASRFVVPRGQQARASGANTSSLRATIAPPTQRPSSGL